MAVTIETLQQRMEEAALALDFEEAKRCRDMINMIRGGATAAEAEDADFEGLTRQEPGAMGLGTSQQSVTPPADWRPPPRPDPMTAGRSQRGRRRGP
ncbi:UvrB/UvrC motif-containing protein [Sphingomonas gellani]|nr:UvrB/UvrC motif-containing protein [Sphingomonas gellani]